VTDRATSTDPLTAVTANPSPVDELLGRYARGAEVLRTSIADMGADALRVRPIAGKWSSLEVVAHIVDADQFMCDRMKRTIATDSPLLMGVESIQYLEPLHYHDRDPELDIRLLEIQREQMLGDLTRLPAEAWERPSIHSEVGMLTLRQLLSHAVRHLESHVEAIAEKRAALTAVEAALAE
jgi:uncharacterized damage-inducible protein DinB